MDREPNMLLPGGWNPPRTARIPWLPWATTYIWLGSLIMTKCYSDDYRGAPSGLSINSNGYQGAIPHVATQTRCKLLEVWIPSCGACSMEPVVWWCVCWPRFLPECELGGAFVWECMVAMTTSVIHLNSLSDSRLGTSLPPPPSPLGAASVLVPLLIEGSVEPAPSSISTLAITASEVIASNETTWRLDNRLIDLLEVSSQNDLTPAYRDATVTMLQCTCLLRRLHLSLPTS